MLSQKEALMYLESIGNNDSIGVTIVTKEGIIIFRNRGQEQLSGKPNSELIGTSIADSTDFKEVMSVIKTGTPKFGLLYKTIFGTQAVVHRIPLRDSNYRVIGAMTITIFSDIKDMEELLYKFNVLTTRLNYYEEQLTKFRSARFSFATIVGRSEKITSAINLAKKYALSNSPVLITGESGTGKELFAHAIHLASSRSKEPFIIINCPSIPEALLESELFGYAPGAFSGATKGGKIGKFEMANNGSIFLDEVSSLNMSLQPKLLRVLQDQRIEKLGSNKYVDLNFRVIAATNKDLKELVEQGLFREDLYYRISVLNIDLPPLRERKEDIPLFIENYLNLLRQERGSIVENVSGDSMDAFYDYSWPGNCRELKNVLEKAATSCEGKTIRSKDLPDYLYSKRHSRSRIDDLTTNENLLKLSKQAAEKKLLEAKLESNNWNKTKTANQLGISRPLLYSLIKKYGLSKPKKVNLHA